MNDSVFASLEAERALAIGDPMRALTALQSAKPERSSAFSRRYVIAALSAWDYEGTLGYLDETDHNLSPTDEAHFRFQAHWGLGQASEAAAVLAQVPLQHPLNIHTLRNMHRLSALVHKDAGEQMVERVRALENELTEATMNDITGLMASYAYLQCLDDIERLAASSPDDILGPASRIHLARARYANRDFEGAMAALQPLHGTWWRWDGDKLAARILFELGNASEALDNRSHRRPTTEFDEVEFHALLTLGRFEEAFDLYLSPADTQIVQQVFSGTAHVNGTLERVDHRFIIMQSGPGDEIMLASLYAQASRYSHHLSVTCEPRLEPLLRQSFPSIEFLPVRRLKSDDFGWRRDSPDRVKAGQLALLLDEKALKVAQGADSVVMGRSLPSALGSAGLPAARYLRPSHEAQAWAATLRRGRPTIGVVWRSEMQSSMRNIHYLKVDDLAPLLPGGVDVICLQHDVTAEEQVVLESITQSLIDLKGIDLRNDFDSAAAVLGLCDIVVGVGTTITELAGAVGTQTVMLQPTHFGTWRGQSSDNRDYWHESVLVPAVDEPWKSAKLIAKARSQLDLLLSSL